jgi:hypothetical protein
MFLRALVPLSCLLLISSTLAAEADVFGGFTAHIRHQVQSDKVVFAEAQTCTEWFYRQLRPNPSKPPSHGVSLSAEPSPSQPTSRTSDCRTRYPNGLEAARKDFSLSQSLLSVSLTFYQFALVGDRDDNARYSMTELRDMLESFGLPFNEILPPSAHLAVLNAQFDTLHQSRGLEALMAGMSILYERGYRLTVNDQAFLNQVLG